MVIVMGDSGIGECGDECDLPYIEDEDDAEDFPL